MIVALFRLLVGLLPASRGKNAILSATGKSWNIAPTARVGSNVFWRVGSLRVDDGAIVGLVNVFRALQDVHIRREAVIGQLNWFSAAAQVETGDVGALHRSLYLDDQSAITSRHFIDCSGGVFVGRRTTVAGVRSTIMSHGPDFIAGSMNVAPVRIGEYCFIAANTLITMGCTVSDRVVVAAGSVVAADLTDSDSLYGGVPAKWIHPINGAQYFVRTGLRIDRNVVGRKLPD